MMQYFDTHAHLLDERFDDDRAALAASLPEQRIALMLEACTNAKDAARVLSFVKGHSYMVAALGTHPHDAAHMEEADLAGLSALLADEKAVAVGEIGLDYHYDFSPVQTQRHWFERQLALAAQLKLPAVLHMREATSDMLSILRAYSPGLSGVMHCFSAGYETAKECLDMGLYIAFGGALTFKNAKRNVDVAKRLPMDRLLIETDCPYMTPVPYRSKRNDPSLVALVCEALADIKGLAAQDVAHITLQNGKRLFGIV